MLLHACCAPCSSAIVEWMLQNGVRPTIFYFNPNIFPRQEYDIRKAESKRHAESLGIEWIDGDYDHQSMARCRQGAGRRARTRMPLPAVLQAQTLGDSQGGPASWHGSFHHHPGIVALEEYRTNH